MRRELSDKQLRNALGRQQFATAWAFGAALSLDEAVAVALVAPEVNPMSDQPTTLAAMGSRAKRARTRDAPLRRPRQRILPGGAPASPADEEWAE